MTEIVFHDRYSATGREHNGCDRCDGMGCAPISRQRVQDDKVWAAADKVSPNPIGALGFRMVRCPDCAGPKSATEPPAPGEQA